MPSADEVAAALSADASAIRPRLRSRRDVRAARRTPCARAGASRRRLPARSARARSSRAASRRRTGRRSSRASGSAQAASSTSGPSSPTTVASPGDRALRSAAFDPQLPRDVWLLQIGGVMNSFGNGVVLPFLVIYLHDVRGFGLGVVRARRRRLRRGAALRRACSPARWSTGSAPRRVLGGGLVMQAVGFGLFPLVREPWQAFVLIAIEGAGSAGFWPSQSTLIARLTPPARRHAAYAQQRVTMNLGIGLGGLDRRLDRERRAARARSRSSSSSTQRRSSRTSACSLRSTTRALADDEGAAGRASYRAVLRDRLFVGLWTLNFLFVAAGYSLFNLVPPFARDHAHVSERQIGVFFFVNTALIVIVQLPISRAIEGRRRMRALALMPALWIVAWLMLDAGALLARRDRGVRRDHGRARRSSGSASASTGRRTRRSSPRSRPTHLRGRYFAVHSLSWGLAGTVGPAVGGFILARRRSRSGRSRPRSASSPRSARSRSSGACRSASAGSRATSRAARARLAYRPVERETALECRICR